MTTTFGDSFTVLLCKMITITSMSLLEQGKAIFATTRENITLKKKKKHQYIVFLNALLTKIYNFI